MITRFLWPNYGIKIFSDSLPHELRARGRAEPLWTPKQTVRTVMREIEADRRKIKAALAQNEGNDCLLTTAAHSAGERAFDNGNATYNHRPDQEQEREEYQLEGEHRKDDGPGRFQESKGKAKTKNVSFVYDG